MLVKHFDENQESQNAVTVVYLENVQFPAENRNTVRDSRENNVKASIPKVKSEKSKSSLCSEKSGACPICNKVVGRLQEHLRHVHVTDRSKKCTFCDKAFKSSPSLRQHSRRVHGSRSIMCSLCNKSFSFNTELKMHMLKHRKDPAYKARSLERIRKVGKAELENRTRNEQQRVTDVGITARSNSTTIEILA
jgi:uncharacterized Zn-finger protein